MHYVAEKDGVSYGVNWFANKATREEAERFLDEVAEAAAVNIPGGKVKSVEKVTLDGRYPGRAIVMESPDLELFAPGQLGLAQIVCVRTPRAMSLADRTMDRDNLLKDHASKLHSKIREMLGYLFRLRDRCRREDSPKTTACSCRSSGHTTRFTG